MRRRICTGLYSRFTSSIPYDFNTKQKPPLTKQPLMYHQNTM